MNPKAKNLKTMVQGAYDLQKLRIMAGNRIVANFKAKLGLEPGEKEDQLDKEGKNILKTLREDHRRITDGVIFPTARQWKPEKAGQELISSYVELCLVDNYIDLESREAATFNRIGSVIKAYDIWNEFLIDVKGVGPAMAGVIIGEIDIHKARYASCIHVYAGLDVAPDGKGRSRRKEHLVEQKYIDAEGNEKTKMGITFNPWLKTKLMGVLSSSFLRTAGKDGYGELYYQYKHRIENMPAHQDKTAGHRHNMALRWMIKRFLTDLYTIWRYLEALPVSVEYAEGKLGLLHEKQPEWKHPMINEILNDVRAARID